MKQEQPTPAEIKEWQEKARKWDALNEKISKFYKDDESEDAEGALDTIGEIAAAAFGYL